MKSPSTEIFARNWRVYQEISKCNYMSHHDFSAQISLLLQNGALPDKAIDVLDCGCGDAWMLSRLLKGRNINSFTGYDMSDAALSYAEKSVEPLECELSLQAGPMEELIKKEQRSFNLIYSSFAIHHLQDTDKKLFLKNLSNHLKNGGVLIIIDLLRDENLTREQYLEEYIQNIGITWKTVSSDEKDLVYDHIRNFDFPANTNAFLYWMEESGFNVRSTFSPDSRNVMITAVKQAS